LSLFEGGEENPEFRPFIGLDWMHSSSKKKAIGAKTHPLGGRKREGMGGILIDKGEGQDNSWQESGGGELCNSVHSKAAKPPHVHIERVVRPSKGSARGKERDPLFK